MNRTPETIVDELLVLRAQDGDAKSLQRLAQRWHARLLGHAHQVTGRRDAAADVVQEAWLSIIRGLAGLKDPAAFRGWAFRIVHHRAVDWVRRQQRQREVFDDLSRQSDQQETGDTDDNQEELIKLRSVIRALTPDQKLLVRMYYTEQMRIKEIAATLSMPQGTVKYQLFQIRKQLKLKIERTTRNDR